MIGLLLLALDQTEGDTLVRISARVFNGKGCVPKKEYTSSAEYKHRWAVRHADGPLSDCVITFAYPTLLKPNVHPCVGYVAENGREKDTLALLLCLNAIIVF